MELSDIVSIVITSATRTPSQAGFGVPLIVSHSAAWTERTRTYSSLTEVADDFATTTPEYKAAAKMFAQNPSVRTVMIGRANGAAPTQRFEFTPVVKNSYVYTFTANGLTVTYTSDASATATEITTGLKAAFDALSPLPAFTSSLQSANTILRLVASTAGNWMDIKSEDPNLPVIQNHAEPGSAGDFLAELNAIRTEDKSWYGLVTTMNSKAIIDIAAGFAESSKVLYLAQTQDSVVRDNASSGTDDVGESTAAAGYGHTAVVFSPGTGDFLDAAMLGAVFPLQPGSETWAYKQLASVTPGIFTGTMRAHLEAKNVGFYEATAGLNITFEGKVASGEYIDVTRFTDFLEARLAEEIFSVLANAKKIPYTGAGIAMIQGAVSRVLKQAANPPYGGITLDYEVLVPDIADVSSADKAARTLNNVTFSATLTGAIHKANIEGTVSV